MEASPEHTFSLDHASVEMSFEWRTSVHRYAFSGLHFLYASARIKQKSARAINSAIGFEEIGGPPGLISSGQKGKGGHCSRLLCVAQT
jgi:hypothetical protein